MKTFSILNVTHQLTDHLFIAWVSRVHMKTNDKNTHTLYATSLLAIQV